MSVMVFSILKLLSNFPYLTRNAMVTISAK